MQCILKCHNRCDCSKFWEIGPLQGSLMSWFLAEFHCSTAVAAVTISVLFTYLYCGLKSNWTSYCRESTRRNERQFDVDLYTLHYGLWVLRISWVMPSRKKVRWCVSLLPVPCRECYSCRRGVECGKKMKSVNTVNI